MTISRRNYPSRRIDHLSSLFVKSIVKSSYTSQYMSNQIKTYFLPPTWDYPPSGPIKLGAIIITPSRANIPLNLSSIIPIPPASLIAATSKHNWEWHREKTREGKVGIWTRFLQVVLGIEADVGMNWNIVNDEVYKFERMESQSFTPEEAYVTEALKAPSIMRFLEKSSFKKPVYMVTGIRVAYGAKVKSVFKRGYGGQAKIGVDGTGSGVPVSIGPELEVQNSNKTGTEFDGGSDFVFAFQLTRISFKGKTRDLDVEAYNKGSMLGIKQKDKTKDGVQEGRVEDVSTAEQGSTAADFGYVAKGETVDGEDELPCECVVAK